jgi:hypothetical protein
MVSSASELPQACCPFPFVFLTFEKATADELLQLVQVRDGNALPAADILDLAAPGLFAVCFFP